LRHVLGTLAEVALLDVISPLLFLACCVALAFGYGQAKLAVIAVALMAISLVRQWVYLGAIRRLGFDPRLANYLLVGAALFSLLLVNSTLAYRLKRGVQWKGRSYPDGGKGLDGP
jgi:Na+-translocating ferredoxin:NAD+ oxidoreductase RnfE subunit